MNTAAAKRHAMVKKAISALQAGDGVRAREAFERVVALGGADASIWLGLAIACARLDDGAAALEAVDKSLAMDPRNIRAVIFKADHLGRQGGERQALELYQYALRLAAKAGELPHDVTQALQRAKTACEQKNEEYKAFLLDKIRADGFSPGPENYRFQQSLDIMFGTKKIYHQEPRRYYYPGLPLNQFYEREQFGWVPAVEAATDGIRSELMAVMREPSRFSPYLKTDSTHLNRDYRGLADSDDWGALYVWDYGHLVPEHARLFPQTVKALEAAPLPVIPHQAPMALFSKLTPGTRIPPHNGLLNSRLICHLPIIVPEHCGALRVGNEQRPWVEGKLLIFDDSIEHEAWNSSAEERVILLFEVWRPELSDEEKRLITTVLAAVKAYYASDSTPGTRTSSIRRTIPR